MSGFLKFLLALLPALIEWIKGWGAREERVRIEKEQQEAADAMREDFDRLAGDGRDHPTAISELRARAKARDGGLP